MLIFVRRGVSGGRQLMKFLAGVIGPVILIIQLESSITDSCTGDEGGVGS